jgi:hypothetical protein
MKSLKFFLSPLVFCTVSFFRIRCLAFYSLESNFFPYLFSSAPLCFFSISFRGSSLFELPTPLHVLWVDSFHDREGSTNCTSSIIPCPVSSVQFHTSFLILDYYESCWIHVSWSRRGPFIRSHLNFSLILVTESGTSVTNAKTILLILNNWIYGAISVAMDPD